MRYDLQAILKEKYDQRDRRSAEEKAEVFIDNMISRYLSEIKDQKQICIESGNTEEIEVMDKLSRRFRALQQINMKL